MKLKSLYIVIILGIILLVNHKSYSIDTLYQEPNSRYKINNTARMIKFTTNSIKAVIKKSVSKNDSVDIYPSRIPDSPVIIYYYGGRYQLGNKEQCSFIGKNLSSYGYTVVIPQQLKYPKNTFGNIIQDQISKLNSIKSYIKNFNGDSSNISVIGHSSGGHIASYIYNKDCKIKTCFLIDPFGLCLSEYYNTNTLDNRDLEIQKVFCDNKLLFMRYDIALNKKRDNCIIFLGEFTNKRVSYHTNNFIKISESKLYIVKNKTHIYIMIDLISKRSLIYKKIQEHIN